jgi:hypothetical protein
MDCVKLGNCFVTSCISDSGFAVADTPIGIYGTLFFFSWATISYSSFNNPIIPYKCIPLHSMTPVF